MLSHQVILLVVNIVSNLILFSIVRIFLPKKIEIDRNRALNVVLSVSSLW
jgi:hypothetical protein